MPENGTDQRMEYKISVIFQGIKKSLFVCLSPGVCLSACLSIHLLLSICPSVCLLLCVYLTVSAFVSLCTCLPVSISHSMSVSISSGSGVRLAAGQETDLGGEGETVSTVRRAAQNQPGQQGGYSWWCAVTPGLFGQRTSLV